MRIENATVDNSYVIVRIGNVTVDKSYVIMRNEKRSVHRPYVRMTIKNFMSTGPALE